MAQTTAVAKKQEGAKEIEYVAADNQKITLSTPIVRKYLVRGKPELVTEQEIMFFLAVCKARAMNPYVGDCYLIKFTTEEGAAIVTSIDYFRRRARAQKDCQGWKVGLLVKKPDGTVKETSGLVLDDEELVGAWFEAKPVGWEFPRRLEVNLKGYIKTKKDGGVTKFWSEEKQPTMIAKVAEAQGLRMVWPGEFGKIYSTEEVSPDGSDSGPIVDVSTIKSFDELLAEKKLNDNQQAMLNQFIEELAKANKVTPDEIKESAAQDFDSFWKAFRAKAAEGKKAEPKKEEPEKIPCPNDEGRPVDSSECDKCVTRPGCPAWE